MISSNTRASRSRYSSPAQPQKGRSDWKGGALEASKSTEEEPSSQSFMKRWLEPTIQNKASFEEAGLMRHGVLDGMAALGTLPKTKKPAANEGDKAGSGHGGNGNVGGVKKIILRPSGSHAALGSPTATSTPTNVPEASNTSTTPPPPSSALAARRPLPTSREEDDEDYDPKPGKGGRRKSGRVSLPKKSRRSSVASSHQPLPSASPTKITFTSVNQMSTPEGEPELTGEAEAASEVKAEPQTEGETEGETEGQAEAEAEAEVEAEAEAEAEANADAEADAEEDLEAESETAEAEEEADEEEFEIVTKESVGAVVEQAVYQALRHYRYPTAWALRSLFGDKAKDEAFLNMLSKIYTQTADEATMQQFTRMLEKRKKEGKKNNQGRDLFVPPLLPGARNDDDLALKPKNAPYAKLLVQQNSSHAQVEDGGDTRAVKRVKVGHVERSPHKSIATPTIASTPVKAVNGNGSVNGPIKTPLSKRRTRRGSASSDSSLSSVQSLSSPEVTMHRRIPSAAPAQAAIRGRPSTAVRESLGKGKVAAEEVVLSESESEAKSRSRSRDATARGRPISTRGKSSTSKTATSEPAPSSLTTTTTTTTNQQNRDRHNSSSGAKPNMPGRLESSGGLFPNLPGKKTSTAAVASTPAAAKDKEDPKSQAREENEVIWSRRREAQKITNDYEATESSVRNDGFGNWEMDTPTRVTRSGRQTTAASVNNTVTRSTRQSVKRSHEDPDGTVSPVALSFHGDNGLLLASRASTPNALRPAKKQKSGVRVKLS